MNDEVVWEGDTDHNHYQVVDTMYDGRPARVLYSGARRAAQSGVAKDANRDLLFDYNQRMFELATNLGARRILLIGGAVATLPTALYHALPDVEIDIVEPDAGLIDIAYTYFNLPVDDRIRIVTTDGRSFLREHADVYDLVLVDAFIHSAIPQDMRTIEAFETYAKHLTQDGVFAMNIISGYYGKTAQVMRSIYAAAAIVFSDVQLFLAGRGYSMWLPQNFVLTGQMGTTPLKDYVRHEAIAPPEVRSDEALHDE